MRVYRLEFEQPDGRWTGPYCAEWMTIEAFDIRTAMIEAHCEDDPMRPWPDARLFAAHPGFNRYVCGTDSLASLGAWFGRHFLPLLGEGGHTAVYEIPPKAVGWRKLNQIVFQERRAVLVDRVGIPVPRERIVERIHPLKRARTEGGSVS